MLAGFERKTPNREKPAASDPAARRIPPRGELQITVGKNFAPVPGRDELDEHSLMVPGDGSAAPPFCGRRILPGDRKWAWLNVQHCSLERSLAWYGASARRRLRGCRDERGLSASGLEGGLEWVRFECRGSASSRTRELGDGALQCLCSGGRKLWSDCFFAERVKGRTGRWVVDCFRGYSRRR
jgi:hypothetical protein